MFLYILSDLHLEFGEFVVPEIQPDVVLLAGDVHIGTKGVEWALHTFPNTPVLYVAGNHEFYGHAVPALYDKLRRKSHGSLLHVLENESIRIGNVVFYGCTLWSDFALFGNADRSFVMDAVQQRMTDFRRIRLSPSYSRFRASHAVQLHYRAKTWLQSVAQEQGKKVVITHHAPSALSLAPDRRYDVLSAAYASHCDELVAASGAALWIHGHTHHAVDYMLGNTRVLSNPRGYADEPVAEFQPRLIVEV